VWRTIRFLWVAYLTYRRAGDRGSSYSALVSVGGVPHTTILVATGREAWRVSTIAMSAFDRRRPEEF
jgi:hypothetical protein